MISMSMVVISFYSTVFTLPSESHSHVLPLHSFIYHSSIPIGNPLTLIIHNPNHHQLTIIAQPPPQRGEWTGNRHTTTPTTAALAANFRHSIVTSLLSVIIFNRKLLITDCSRM
ncbi:hypothetical protein Hanom_Chr05g00452161 [Helianthus anomalus]